MAAQEILKDEEPLPQITGSNRPRRRETIDLTDPTQASTRDIVKTELEGQEIYNLEPGNAKASALKKRNMEKAEQHNMQRPHSIIQTNPRRPALDHLPNQRTTLPPQHGTYASRHIMSNSNVVPPTQINWNQYPESLYPLELGQNSMEAGGNKSIDTQLDLMNRYM